MRNDIHFRWMIRADMSEVGEFDSAPWNEGYIRHMLRSNSVIGHVAEIDDQLVGYTIYRLTSSSIELLQACVKPKLRRQGIGRFMVEKIKTKLDWTKRNILFAQVLESDLPSQLFFRSCGLSWFKTNGVGAGESLYTLKFVCPVLRPEEVL